MRAFSSFGKAACSLLCALPIATTALHARYTAERDNILYNVVEDRSSGTKLEFVKNSGICETTPGVNSYSGYLTVGPDMNMFFWFFEARNKPKEAPLVGWVSGGPGSSSMQGLFKDHGPCQFYNGETEPSLNPYSYNEFANIIYFDQPIGAGFSYGQGCCNSSETAAIYVWNFLQMFYASFPEYNGRDFGFMAQSYGGRYSPVFASYLLDQNARIASGELADGSIPIKLVALGVSDGIFNQKIWYKSWIEYSLSNPYRSVINASFAETLYNYYDTSCKPLVEACYDRGTIEDCVNATNICVKLPTWIETNSSVQFSQDDIRQAGQGIFPPESPYENYLYREDIQKAIGARVNYTFRSFDAYVNITSTGDYSRPSAIYMPAILAAGVKTIIYTGDADWIIPWISNKAEAESIEWPCQEQFTAKEMVPYAVNGTEKGQFKNVENLTYMRVYEAGHDLAYFQPETALQILRQLFTGGFVSTLSTSENQVMVRTSTMNP